ncbi:trigger factor [Marinilabilia salmonicolor]|jgi:trigger factor|uniref:trigger factor n=1 Tax=Marinilabilia salmonicolor TaxID=989 RepID=UPI000D068C41|nr:trigger factor [Marinilabilia salmonicolor]PRZ01261.1 trigger factor [Marinilabilia salmonicolor]
MNIEKEQIDDLNAVVHITLEKDDYEPRVETVLKDYRKKVNMPGFRPGKVPASLVKKMYGKAVLVDEINKLVSENLSSYITENKLDILGEPLPSEKQQTIDFDNDEQFKFSFDLGLTPEVEVKLTKREKLPFYNIEVTDDMLDGQKKNVTSRFGTTEPREEAGEKSMLKGDFVQLDQKGEPLEDGIKAEDAVMSTAIIKTEKEKKKIVGAKVGDEIVFEPKKAFPNDTEISYLLKISKEEAAALEGKFRFTVKEITEYIDPELNQELFDKIFGPGKVTNEEEFTAQVKEDLENTLKMESEYKFTLDAKEKLMGKVDMKLPEEFLKRWIKATNQNKEEQDFTDEQIDQEMPRFLEDLKWQIVRNQLIKENDLKVEQQDVIDFAKKSAKLQFMQYGLNNVPDEHIESYAMDMLKNEDQQRSMAEGAINDKVMDFVKEAVKIEEKEVSRDEFNKLFEKSQKK